MRLLIDTSVLINWLHDLTESEVAEAHAIRDAHVRGELDAHQLDDIVEIVGPPLAMPQAWLREAAVLTERHALTFYDASWAATAAALRMPLVSADHSLLATGLAETPSAVAGRSNLKIQ